MSRHRCALFSQGLLTLWMKKQKLISFIFTTAMTSKSNALQDREI